MTDNQIAKTPREHYLRAEYFLKSVDDLGVEYDGYLTEAVVRGMELALQRAQVHATLATVDPSELP